MGSKMFLHANTNTNNVRFEILINLEYYSDFINSNDTDCIEELDKFFESKNYGVDLTDIIVIALANTFECRVDILNVNDEKREYYLPGSQYHILPSRKNCVSKYELKFLKVGDHYDALISKLPVETISYIKVEESQTLNEDLNSWERENESETSGNVQTLNEDLNSWERENESETSGNVQTLNEDLNSCERENESETSGNVQTLEDLNSCERENESETSDNVQTDDDE